MFIRTVKEVAFVFLHPFHFNFPFFKKKKSIHFLLIQRLLNFNLFFINYFNLLSMRLLWQDSKYEFDGLDNEL